MLKMQMVIVMCAAWRDDERTQCSAMVCVLSGQRSVWSLGNGQYVYGSQWRDFMFLLCLIVRQRALVNGNVRW